MSNGEDTGSLEERSGEEISSGKPHSGKPQVRKWVGVNIKFIDGHFLASFNHDLFRVFHNMEELLAAIEVEAGRLTVSS